MSGISDESRSEFRSELNVAPDGVAIRAILDDARSADETARAAAKAAALAVEQRARESAEEKASLAAGLVGLSLEFPRRYPGCDGGVVTFNDDFSISTSPGFRKNCLALPETTWIVVGSDEIEFAGDQGTWTLRPSGAGAEYIAINRKGYSSTYFGVRIAGANPWAH